MPVVLLPGSTNHLLDDKSTTALDVRWLTVHTMVGTLAGTESWFTPSGRPYSHFGVGGRGELWQWQDLRYRAASDLQGNPYSISFECEDRGSSFPAWSGSDVPGFTDRQADALVVALSWCCHRFGLPRTAIRSSCPHERGIGWHRLGIDPWRRSDCLKWSNATGKVCPGDRRIHQLKTEIIPAVSAPEDDMTPDQMRDVLDSYARRIHGVDGFGTWMRYVYSASRQRELTMEDVQHAVDNVLQVHNVTEDSALRETIASEVAEALAPQEPAEG